MKVILLFILLLFSRQTQAQQLTGMLMGEFTRMPLVNAKITAGNNAVLSNPSGVFIINIPPHTDSIRITAAGYTPYAFRPGSTNRADTLVIYIKPIAYALKQVNIKANRNFKADSLRLRKEFGAVFAYKAPKVTDALYKRPVPNPDIPDDHITSQRNATSIVGVDLLSVASLLSKKKNKTSHLQSILLQQEANNYADQLFSKQKVTLITGLQGDSLRNFMEQYRPTGIQLKKMTDYELVIYIKESYIKFKAK
jgi:hypothetical protein